MYVTAKVNKLLGAYMDTITKYCIALVIILSMTSLNASYLAGADFVLGEKPDGGEVNPRGVWSYGYRDILADSTLNLTLNHFNSSNDSNGFHDEIEGYDDVVAIYANTGATPSILNFNGFGDLRPLNSQQMALHPGAANQFAIVRWTAEVSDTFDIVASWLDLDTHGGNGASGHVVINGINIGAMERFWGVGGGGAATGTFNLNIGDTVDFAVGSMGSYFFDTTAFDATISVHPSTAPEVGSAIQICFGVIFLIIAFRHKRKVLNKIAISDDPIACG